MNFNLTHKNEYVLNNAMICECINLYGIEVKLIKTEKQNYDEEVFGDRSHIKVDCKNNYDIVILPETPDQVDSQDYSFGDFGFSNSDTCTVYVSAQRCFKLGFDINNLMGCLIVFPTNKVMEITDVSLQAPSVNNLWSYNDAKSVLKLSLSAYNFKSADETKDIQFTDEMNSIDDLDDSTLANGDYDALDGYFDKLLNDKKEQDFEAEVKDCVNTVKVNGIEKGIDDIVKKPIVDNNEHDVFGW